MIGTLQFKKGPKKVAIGADQVIMEVKTSSQKGNVKTITKAMEAKIMKALPEIGNQKTFLIGVPFSLKICG